MLDDGAKLAQHYGQIRTVLERHGTPIGVNDLHIAAQARSARLTVVSNNLREFEQAARSAASSIGNLRVTSFAFTGTSRKGRPPQAWPSAR